MKRVIPIALGLVGVDLGCIVITGGVSAFGPVEPSGFALRLGVALALVGWSYRLGARSSIHGYLALLLLMLTLLHYRGFRLRGDGLWYYSFAHSLVFDRDLDLGNQYRRLGIDHYRGSQVVPETGLPRYTFPMGVALVWPAFVGLGHLGAWLRNLHGLPTSYDGFSDPYLHGVALGNLLIGWLGLLVLERFLRKWFSPVVRFIGSVGIALGSFLLWYMTYHSVYTHALTFFLASLLLLLWSRRPGSIGDYSILGLLVGLMACVRWQNAVFGLLPVSRLAGELTERRWRFAAGAVAALGASSFLGALPQLVSWKIIFGRFWIGVPLGPGYMQWSSPFVTETLFSSRHGLFSWSPILLFAAAGLAGFAFRRPRWGVPLLGLFLLQIYVNSAVSDWWAGGSFGARRFDSVLPVLAIGLAQAVDWLTESARRWPAAVAAAVVAVFVLGNVLIMEQYRKGRIPADDTLSWERAAAGMMEDVFDGVGYPFSFPANWAFAFEYDRPKTQYDLLVGKYLFHFLGGEGGVIDLGTSDPPFIGNGWTGVHDEDGRQVRSAIGPRAGIFVPLFEPESLRIRIECRAPSETVPEMVELWLNGFRLGVFLPGLEMQEHSFTATKRWWKRLNLLELAPVEPASGRVYLAVDRFRFEPLAPSSR